MTHRHSWIPMVAALAVFVLAAFALTASTGAPLTAPGAPAVSASGPFAACDGAALAAPTDFTAPAGSTAVAQPGGSDAACRRAPECSVDSDCDIICGVGLGHCVHASCPTRICKCR